MNPDEAAEAVDAEEKAILDGETVTGNEPEPSTLEKDVQGVLDKQAAPPAEGVEGTADAPAEGEAVKEEAKSEAPAPAIPDELLAVAEQMGFNREDAAAFPSARALLTAMDVVAYRTQGQQAKQEAPPKQEAAKPKPAPEFAFTPEFLDPDVIPEEVGKNMVAFHDHVNAKLASVNEALEAVQTQMQMVDEVHRRMLVQQAAERDARLDGAIAAWGKDWEKTFGKGDVAAVQKNAAAMKARQQLDVMAQVLAPTLGSKLSETELYERARDILWKDDAARMERQKIAGQLKGQSQRRTAPVVKKPGAVNDNEQMQQLLVDVQGLLNRE